MSLVFESLCDHQLIINSVHGFSLVKQMLVRKCYCFAFRPHIICKELIWYLFSIVMWMYLQLKTRSQSLGASSPRGEKWFRSLLLNAGRLCFPENQHVRAGKPRASSFWWTYRNSSSCPQGGDSSKARLPHGVQVRGEGDFLRRWPTPAIQGPDDSEETCARNPIILPNSRLGKALQPPKTQRRRNSRPYHCQPLYPSGHRICKACNARSSIWLM